MQQCKRFEVPYYVIHDWDLFDENVDITGACDESNPIYKSLDSIQRGHYSRNSKILNIVGDFSKIHYNKINLEEVLKIEDKDKGAISVYSKIEGKSYEEIIKEYPAIISNTLTEFLGIN